MTRRRSNCKKDKEAKQCGNNKKRPPCLRKAVSLLCMVLFPLNSCRWLGGYVEHYAVDLWDFVADAARDRVEQFVGQMHPLRRHRVQRGYGAQRDRFAVGAHVADHADAAHRQQSAESLPDGII